MHGFIFHLLRQIRSEHRLGLLRNTKIVEDGCQQWVTIQSPWTFGDRLVLGRSLESLHRLDPSFLQQLDEA